MVYLTTAGKLWVNIGLIVLSILIGGLVFWLPYLKKRKSVSLRLFFAENRLLFYTALALVFGFISRTAFLDLLPGGLNQDEASAGYDAYAIFKYGIDRNGIRYPVHLVAWGSGQNALYSYLCRFCWRWASTRSLCGCLWPLLAAYLSFSCIASCFAVLARARLFWACSFSSLIPGI